MRRQSACRHRLQQPFPASCQGGCDTCYPSHRKQRSSSLGAPAWGLLLFLLLAFWVSSCKGAPMVSHVLQGEQDLHLWNEIDEACSAYLAKDTLLQSSSALEEFCFMVLGLLQKMQVFDEKDNTKRFLFHYSKTHDTGNSNILSSVLHPLLQLVPHLHEKRLKRYKVDEELRIPGGIQSRGYFVFRPRNGRRSATFR